jgi:glycosidase
MLQSVKDKEVVAALTDAVQGRSNPYPSPAAWEDQLLYFLLPDRFSNGQEIESKSTTGQFVNGTTPMFQSTDAGSVEKTAADKKAWFEAGGRYVGGTLKGIISKIGYLQRLGVTALWVGPIFKQVPGDDSLYHGYACQNFLEVEPRLGTREDLKELVKTAHNHGIYVILDIILNHSGDVFGYVGDTEPNWTGQTYPVAGFRDSHGKATVPFRKINTQLPPDNYESCAVWPSELQDPSSYTCKGKINNWDWYPEYLEGDFITLKDLNIGPNDPDNFIATPALKALCEVYKYWIAFADIDGFRIDTVKVG